MGIRDFEEMEHQPPRGAVFVKVFLVRRRLVAKFMKPDGGEWVACVPEDLVPYVKGCALYDQSSFPGTVTGTTRWCFVMWLEGEGPNRPLVVEEENG